eukprot:TRINITY_DN2474_c0_g1_i1.p1 TRINITY_DN2474_c0_g1~~TRINITY_DN2474_c0_g1_i1.p1  ORF type:complete len:755 (-),score=374.32 TRINITY_DN2474_c0_g1_i1:175-2439(-)
MSFTLVEEERDGVRFSWNIWPKSRAEATRAVIPIGCIYTPLKQTQTLFRAKYEPVICKGSCKTVLNPFCAIDIASKIWVCPFCFQRNPFPQQYMTMTEQVLPAELINVYTTIEYELPRSVSSPPIFLFVIDTCIDEIELKALKESLIAQLALLPEGALVGLITFASTVQVYELAFQFCPKSFVFSGQREIQPRQVQQLLGLTNIASSQPQPQNIRPMNLAAQQNKRFILPLSECEQMLESILEELQRDSRPIKSDKRPHRCAGAAVAVAAGLLDAYAGQSARILFFLGGPCTYGPGMVTAEDLREHLRSHFDLSKDTAKYVKSAYKYYENIAKLLVQNGHAIDIFACSVDQSGLFEMQELAKKTGGLALLSDTFNADVFKQSLIRSLFRDQNSQSNLGFNGTLEIQTSQGLKVSGIVGHCSSLNKKGTCVGESEIGIGATCAWKLCSIDPNLSLGVFFEVSNQQPNIQAQRGLVQFATQYQTVKGQRILRITTLARNWADNNENSTLINGFDQEAAAVLVARLAAFKADSEESTDVLRWLDRMLVRFIARFADYRKDDISSFRISPLLSIYPQFMFHLRRGTIIQVFNCSPDDTAFNRYLLLRENVSNSLTMIQPTLDAYSFDGPPKPVILSATSVTQDRILLLDSFSHVLTFYGKTIADWKAQGYHKKPEYSSFAQLLEAPDTDVQQIIKDRFPMPTVVKCDQYTSKARILLAVVDPAVTHTNTQKSGEVVFTEDVSLEVFMEHLKKLSVSSS